MRRFFRAQREEDYSQIQYLTAKCNRLTHDKAVLERERLVARERERRLQNDLEAGATRLLHQEQINMELRIKHNQLINRLHQQQVNRLEMYIYRRQSCCGTECHWDLVEFLQQRVMLLVGESCKDAMLLEQVNAELLCLQSSEVQLEGLVEELHAEAQHRAALTEGLQAKLQSKTVELEELRGSNKTLAEELEELHSAHQRKVRELQRQNDGSLTKLQETAEQFEWLCEQQRYWMCSVKRFKDCLMEEKEALLQQVSRLEKKVAELKKSSHGDDPTQTLRCPLQDTGCCDSRVKLWDADSMADLQVDNSRGLYEELFSQAGSTIDGYQKPP